MTAKATCSNCGKQHTEMHFIPRDSEGNPKKGYLGYSRDNTDFWKCEDCGTLNLVPKPE